MLLWAITVDDIIAGLRERGLQNDPTRRELDLICQYTDSALDDAARRLLDMLMARIRQVLGSSVRELHEPRTRPPAIARSSSGLATRATSTMLNNSAPRSSTLPSGTPRPPGPLK